MLVVDIAVCTTLVSPLAIDTTAGLLAAALRYSITGLSPVVVLLLSSLVPANFKSTLVYWRLHDVLPGHRAFSVHAKQDPRINLDALEKNVGSFPDSPRDQNSLWYKLYKKVELETSVQDAHKNYLLFRDLAAISFLLAIVCPAVVGLTGGGCWGALIAAAVFVVQFLLCAVAARHNGNAFVCNVLAHHAVKRRR